MLEKIWRPLSDVGRLSPEESAASEANLKQVCTLACITCFLMGFLSLKGTPQTGQDKAGHKGKHRPYVPFMLAGAAPGRSLGAPDQALCGTRAGGHQQAL